jgi:hypothetical protein
MEKAVCYGESRYLIATFNVLAGELCYVYRRIVDKTAMEKAVCYGESRDLIAKFNFLAG